MTTWQDISTAPKDGTWVFLYHKHARIGGWYWDGGIWNNEYLEWGVGEAEPELSPTHWMPLPEPPKDAGT